jgi:cation-transporting ATPase 13A3/4/5
LIIDIDPRPIKFVSANRSSGSNNNSTDEMTKAESTDRESAFIVDMEKSNGSLSNNNNYNSVSVNSNNYHFAITGKSFNVVRDHYPDVMERLVTRGAIFARMSPDQKETLVSGLQALGYYVAMCGDG